MGFLNFLTRRSKDDGELDRSFGLQNGNPLATASAASVAAHSPVRRPSLEKLQKASDNNRRRQKWTRSTKPHLLGAGSDRPGTANSEGRPGWARPSSSRSKVCLIADSDPASWALSNLSITASGSFSSMRNPGYIDLLDAQGGLRPYDFRARVQAAGVRDYGEDVAERNMGENGVDVRSAAAQEFYEQKKRVSVTTLSNMSHIMEADASTCTGSEAGDMGHFEGSGYSSTRSLSRLSMEPRQEVSGVVAGLSTALENDRRRVKSGMSASKGTPEPRGPRRDQPLASQARQTQRHNGRSSRGRSLSTRHWISTEHSIAGKTRNGRWESQRPSAESRTRSLSPPSVPRYRPGSSMTTMREEDDRPDSDSQSIPRRADFQNDNIEDRQKSDDEQSEYHTPSLNRTHLSYNSNAAPAAPPLQYHPDWQFAIQRAVEESLAKLPLSADLKALLELSQTGVPLDDILRRVPLRHSSLPHGSITSTTPTTDFSDYASSHTGRPHSRHTATTSIDSSARIDLYHKSALCSQEDRSFAGDQCQSSPYLTPDYEEAVISDTSSVPTAQFQRSTRGNGITEIDEYECFTSDYSDVDSFTEKRQQVLEDDETKLFNEGGFGDISNNLPGIVSPREPKNCMICIILANLQGRSVQTRPCTHDGAMTRKQRLRALGYDYDSEESDTERDLAPVKGRTRTKRLTVGSNGGLRRLKLVDDRIDEASEEEKGETTSAGNRPELRRKPKFPNGRTGPVLRQEREAGNVTDTE